MIVAYVEDDRLVVEYTGTWHKDRGPHLGIRRKDLKTGEWLWDEPCPTNFPDEKATLTARLTLGLSKASDSLKLPHEAWRDEDGFAPVVVAIQLMGAARTLLLWR